MPSSSRPHGSSSKEHLVEVGTALEVLRRVNLLAESNALAVDIGGSLAKLLYLQPYGAAVISPRLVIDRFGGAPTRGLSVHVPALSGTLHFFAFETRCVEELVAFLAEHWVKPAGRAASEAVEGAPSSTRQDGGNRRSRGRLHSRRGASRGGRRGGQSSGRSVNHGDQSSSNAVSERWNETHRFVRATGGGAYKYADMFEDEIGVTLVRQDEMTSIVAGLNFLLTAVDREVYTFKPPGDPRPAENLAARSDKPPMSMENSRAFVASSVDPFPYLLVNIGSGVSIVKVTGHGEFERVSGSSLGGGTFWGLARMLLNCRTFDEVISLTNGADNANVDMLVSDIYGGGYQSLGLDADVIAASFGKVTMRKEAATVASVGALWRKLVRAIKGTISVWIAFFLAVPVIGALLRALGLDRREVNNLANLSLSSLFRPQDVALALLRMVSYNIGQIAYLNARVHNLERIYFAGHFIRDHPHTIADLSFAVNFWSGGSTQALFLRHDGYLGAIGAFLGGSADPEAISKAAKTKSQSKPQVLSKSDHSQGSPVVPSPNSDPTISEPPASNAEQLSVQQSENVVSPVTGTSGPGTAVNGQHNGRDGLKSGASEATQPSPQSSSAPSPQSVTTYSGDGGKVDSYCAEETPKSDKETEGSGSSLRKKKRKKKKRGGNSGESSSTVAGGDGVHIAENGSDRKVVYYDDVYHESYRQAVEGEWQTVARRPRRSTGASQSESEEI